MAPPPSSSSTFSSDSWFGTFIDINWHVICACSPHVELKNLCSCKQHQFECEKRFLNSNIRVCVCVLVCKDKHWSRDRAYNFQNNASRVHSAVSSICRSFFAYRIRFCFESTKATYDVPLSSNNIHREIVSRLHSTRTKRVSVVVDVSDENEEWVMGDGGFGADWCCYFLFL